MKNDTIFFSNLKNDEKFSLCKTIARIFAIRLLKSEHSKFFPDYHDGSIHIEVGHVENFSRKEGYGTCRYGWIPDEKLKVKTTTMGSPDYIVWFDVKFGEDVFFEKEKRDIMNWMISENPRYRVLSCYITIDKTQSKICLQFYVLRLGKGWKKINRFFILVYLILTTYPHQNVAKLVKLWEKYLQSAFYMNIRHSFFQTLIKIS